MRASDCGVRRVGGSVPLVRLPAWVREEGICRWAQPASWWGVLPTEQQARKRIEAKMLMRLDFKHAK